MNKNSVPSIWTAQEKVIHVYRLLSFGLGAFALIMGGISVVQSFRNPIVVVRSTDVQEFYPTVRKRAPLEKVDVETFTKRFLSSLYVWDNFNGESLAREIAPFTDAKLVQKIIDAQTQKYVKELKGKRVEQAVTFVRVSVLDDRVTCRFDRVLKIEGIPLVIPTDVTFSMVQGDPTRLNPMGIYISGITESDSAR